MATNKELQAKLDLKKWDKSMEAKMDMSGSMEYCAFCDYSIGGSCIEMQEYREADCLCAKAYRRSNRKNKK